MTTAADHKTGCFHLQPGQRSVEKLIRDAMAQIAEFNLDISPSKASRLVRKEVASAKSMSEAIQNLELRFLAYADPTGETAAANVDRERKLARKRNAPGF